MDGVGNNVVRLQGDQVEWWINGMEFRMDTGATQALALRALQALDWELGSQIGLQLEGLTMPFPDERKRTDDLEKLRASGIGRDNIPVKVDRVVISAPWQREGSAKAAAPVIEPRTRRFTKDKDSESPPYPPAKTTVKKSGTRKQAPEPAPEAITTQLFADPAEQLRYEVRHHYLLTVPLSQREQWPLDETYQILPSFMSDLQEQSGKSVSRQQIVTTVTDVVCSRVNDVQSRRVHPLRVATGKIATSGDPIVTRSFDRAVAYRAYVSRGTPQARRIMWWRTPTGLIVLTRLANHDDMAMPER